ncbi:hypothetical protein MTsPCn9_14750 [Croceitalea sp. MTPC9]|uniref:hypothetical protein n=1 Tax=unclassified Croceitalea TaxID=2632280 RepID=UPI002B3696C3|nr:hypothetical protein MTsPCn6_14380 [Croceitalea sp. MTPC6]GMN16539.1 hypothetical protein MTsPCn9_14750 [Croceitalea sp. MTPC9]
MKKALFGFCLLTLLAFKCENDIEFEDNQRLLLKAKLIDSESNPFGNVPVKVYATKQYGFDLEAAIRSDFGELIGSGVSDAQGNIAITALKPLNASNVYALINFYDSGFNGFKPGTAPLAFNFINEIDLKDNTYDIESIVLDRIEPFQLNTIRNTNQTDTLQYSWSYNAGVKILGDTDPYFYGGDVRENGFDELLPSEQINTHTFNTIESDTVLFEYNIINNGIVETGQLEIIVNEQSGSFEFEF